MGYGPTISDIRRGKKVRLEELINGVMNQSSYSRFVDEKTETSVNNFALLLDNLNFTYDEFMMIARGVPIPTKNSSLAFLVPCEPGTYQP